MKNAAVLLCCVFSVNAWEKLQGYPEPVLAVSGIKIESNGPFKNNIELAFIPSNEKFLMSFYNYSNKDDQVIVPQVEYNARGCGDQSNGIVIEGVIHNIDKKMTNLIFNCDNSVFIRIYNNFNEYATYKITR